MKRAGFYESAEEVSIAATSAEHSWEPPAARYLEAGKVVVAASQWVDDLLDNDAKGICQYSIHTDGAWVWPCSLAYYVKKYHVRLPIEFLNHMEANDWMVGELDESVVEGIFEQLANFTDPS